MPCFPKVHSTPLCFYKIPTLAPVFANCGGKKKKNTKIRRGFSLLLKKAKSETSVQRLFGSSPRRDSSESGPTKLLPPGTIPGISASGLIALNCIREHLCFISGYFVHPLARCVLRYQRGLKELIEC